MSRKISSGASIDPDDYGDSGLSWRILRAIYADYSSWWDYLQPAALFIANTLALEPGVHAVSHRVKDPEHLVEKIIRRSMEQGSPWATSGNYRAVVKDLIGVRALHLFKEDWITVDASIRRHWVLKRRPVANVRKSDPKYVLDEFRSVGCEIELREGYRSVHYQIEARVAKNVIAVELQVRTLFEEAWGEVSHCVEYPYFKGADLIENFLKAMSETAGLGDNLGSATKVLRELGGAFLANKGTAAYKELKSRFHQRLEHISHQPDIQAEILKQLVMLGDKELRGRLTPKK